MTLVSGTKHLLATIVAAVAVVATLVAPSPPGAAGAAGRSKTVNLAYGPDPLQTIVAFPAARPDAPVVVLVPGDRFRSFPTDAAHLGLEGRYLQSAGYSAFALNYRSDASLPPPDPPVAAQIGDVVAGVRYIQSNAATYYGNPSDLTLIGGSAGGFLAGAAALVLDQTPGTVRNVVTLSATTDFASALAYWQALGGKQGGLHQGNIETALGTTTPGTALLDEFSPVQDVTAATAPARWLIFNETAETQPVQQATALATALQATPCAVTLDILSGKKHGYHYWNDARSQIVGRIG